MTALRKQNRSLLPAGILQVEGGFNRGDVVDIYDSDGNQVGSGITNYSSLTWSASKGCNPAL